MGVWRVGCGRESWLVKQRRLGGETSGRALGAVGYQSGCLPKQALRFIINTVSYEVVCAATAAVPMAGSPREAGIDRVGNRGDDRKPVPGCVHPVTGSAMAPAIISGYLGHCNGLLIGLSSFNLFSSIQYLLNACCLPGLGKNSVKHAIILFVKKRLNLNVAGW